MLATHTNGHKLPDRTQLNFDLGIEPEIEVDEPKPCAIRLGHGSWCFLPGDHTGEHEGAPAQYGPVEERPSLWRQRTKGMIK